MQINFKVIAILFCIAFIIFIFIATSYVINEGEKRASGEKKFYIEGIILQNGSDTMTLSPNKEYESMFGKIMYVKKHKLSDEDKSKISEGMEIKISYNGVVPVQLVKTISATGIEVKK